MHVRYDQRRVGGSPDAETARLLLEMLRLVGEAKDREEVRPYIPVAFVPLRGAQRTDILSRKYIG